MKYSHNKNIVPLAKELRKNMTPEEKHLWYDFLRTYPIKFTRQKVIGNYIVDFYCAKANLVIELDGSHHGLENETKKDEIRTEYLKSLGLEVIRIPNYEINDNFLYACRHIDGLVEESLSQLTPLAEAATLLSLCDISPRRGISLYKGALKGV